MNVAKGEKKGDILAGVQTVIATLVAITVRNIKFEADCAIIGGDARDIGLATSVEEKIPCRLLVPKDPQITVALGAVFSAQDKTLKGKEDS